LSRITEALCKGRGLICYLTAGFPSEELFIEHAMASVEGGADVLEIGVPFTDPVADGKIIQMTSQKALDNGITPERVFELTRRLRALTDVPLVLMGYYNPIFQVGEGRYAQLAKEAGADGLIVPDLPLEESQGLREACIKNEIDLIQLVGPTTSEERMIRIARASMGFLYLVSTLGTTGARTSLSSDVGPLVRRAKKAAGMLPVGVGFGISQSEQTEQLYREGADAAIVGSALLKNIMDDTTSQDTRRFVAALRGRCPG
jgi:tryptophan synthase alpha chain